MPGQLAVKKSTRDQIDTLNRTWLAKYPATPAQGGLAGGACVLEQA